MVLPKEERRGHHHDLRTMKLRRKLQRPAKAYEQDCLQTIL